MYDVRAILKRPKISYVNNIGGQVIPFTNNFNKERVFITIAVSRFNLQFVVVIGPVFVIFCDWTCFCLVNSGGLFTKPTICDLCFLFRDCDYG